MQDRYDGHATSLDGPAGHAFTIVPDDLSELPEVTRALYVGIGGALAVVMQTGAEIVLEGVVAGTVLPLRVRQVKTSGTTAGAIVGVL